jgi:hypothetical protein
LKHDEIWEKGVQLKSSPYLWLRNDTRFLAGNILFVENDFSRGWRHDAGQQIKKGRFAGVIGTNQTDNLSLLDRHISKWAMAAKPPKYLDNLLLSGSIRVSLPFITFRGQ